jgi:hypothetical protein
MGNGECAEFRQVPRGRHYSLPIPLCAEYIAMEPQSIPIHPAICPMKGMPVKLLRVIVPKRMTTVRKMIYIYI